MTPAAETLIKKHEEYKEGEDAYLYRVLLKAADESAQNVLAEITAELDRLRKTREESARAREYLELKLREEKIVSLEQKDSAEEERIRRRKTENWRRKNARRNWRQPRPRPHGRGTKRRQPRPPHCGCTRRGNAAYRRSGADCAREFVPAGRRWWSCTRTLPRDREDAKAERGVRSGSGEGKGGEGGGAERGYEKEAEEEELAEDNWKPVTSDEAKRSKEEGGARRPARDTTARERARKARQGQARASGRPAEAAIRATRANAAPRRARHTRHTRLFIAHRTPHTAHYHTTHHIPI
jgi:hypothetical protein